MANLKRLYRAYGIESTVLLLNRAAKFAEGKDDVSIIDVQNELHCGYDNAVLVTDWLQDNFKTSPKLSNHWIRCGRMYCMYNEYISLADMTEKLHVGDRRAYAIMLELVRRKIIRITTDFAFERIKTAATLPDFERAIHRYAKKYRGRCEPELLERVLYISYDKACMLAEHGRDNMGYVWRGKWKNNPYAKAAGGQRKLAETIYKGETRKPGARE